MKPQFNEYYQCSTAGYIRHENVPVDNLTTSKEIPIASKCNEILPYKLHKLEVKEPLVFSSSREFTRVMKQPSLQIPLQDAKKQNCLNYSFSLALIQDPSKILQKDEVHSIHFDEKSSTRIKTIPNSMDLTKSTFTSSRKHNPDMKRSLYSNHNSIMTHYTTSKQNQKIDVIAGQLKKEKEKREEFQKKYEILLNLVNKVQKPKKTLSEEQPCQKPQSTLEHPQSKSIKNVGKKKKYLVKSASESEDQSDQQAPIIIDYKKNRRKGSSPSPIIINFGSELMKQKFHMGKSKNQTHSYQEEENLMEMKQGLNQVKRQVQVLHQNMDYLQKKIDQQQMRHQKQMLMQELKQKQRKIDEIVKENKRIQQINELLVNKKTEKPVANQFGMEFKLQKNKMIVGFLISLLIILLTLNLKSSIC